MNFDFCLFNLDGTLLQLGIQISMAKNKREYDTSYFRILLIIKGKYHGNSKGKYHTNDKKSS